MSMQCSLRSSRAHTQSASVLLKYASKYEFTGGEGETARAANTVAASTRALNDYMYYMYDIHRTR